MGNVVVNEALHQAKDSPRPRAGRPLVDSYIASQAAISTHYFDGSAREDLSPGDDTDSVIGTRDSAGKTIYKGFVQAGGTAPRFSGLKSAGVVGGMYNYFNAADRALTTGWETNNEGRTRQSGLDLGEGFSGVEYFRQPIYLTEDDGTTSTIVSFRKGDDLESSTGMTEVLNTYEMFSHQFASRAKALGAYNGPLPLFNRGLDLNGPGFEFGNATRGHSFQFYQNFARLQAYWQAVVGDQ